MLMYKKKETINEARYLWWMSVDSPYNHRRSLLHVGGLYHCETIYKPKLRLSDDNEKADGHTINCVDVNQNKKL